MFGSRAYAHCSRQLYLYALGRRYVNKEAAGGLLSEGTVSSDNIYVPRQPCPSKVDLSKVEKAPQFDKTLITHLERLSLVRFTDEEAVINLKKAVEYANQLKLVDTKGVEPLETVLEDIDCPLREDIEETPLPKEKVFMNAAELVEDYFVTPPGNVVLAETDIIDFKKIKEWDQSVSKKTKK